MKKALDTFCYFGVYPWPMQAESVKLDKKTLDEVRRIAKQECRPITTQLRILVYEGINQFEKRSKRNGTRNRKTIVK